VATTGRRAWVEPLLEQLLDSGIVETIVTGDDVSRLKPDPEVYQRALDRLDQSPENALAIEDSDLGLRAATAAGLAAVVVSTDYTACGQLMSSVDAGERAWMNDVANYRGTS